MYEGKTLICRKMLSDAGKKHSLFAKFIALQKSSTIQKISVISLSIGILTLISNWVFISFVSSYNLGLALETSNFTILRINNFITLSLWWFWEYWKDLTTWHKGVPP